MSLVVVEHEYDDCPSGRLNEPLLHAMVLRQPQQKQQDVWVVESQAQDVGQESVMALKGWQPIDEDALSTDASLLEPDLHAVVSMSFRSAHEHPDGHEANQDADRFLWVAVLAPVLM